MNTGRVYVNTGKVEKVGRGRVDQKRVKVGMEREEVRGRRRQEDEDDPKRYKNKRSETRHKGVD